MKKIAFILFITTLIIGCSSKKNTIAKKHNLNENISYSTGFDKFLDDFQTEIQGLESLSEYVPSNTMKEEFYMVNMPDGSIGIEGFIQVIPSLFDARSFEQLGGYLTFFADGLYKYQMPVRNILKMLNVKGLVQVDITQKKTASNTQQ